MYPAILITAYNRPASLERLLASLEKAHYPEGSIPLIISIDKSKDREVALVADRFEWKHGPKTIEEKTERMGLKAHIFSLGKWFEPHQQLIVLEDDLLVSPWFYDYATKASSFYAEDSMIAGISLYTYAYSESSFHPFQALNNGSDVHFIQIASSWGQLWNKQHWEDFMLWYDASQTTNQTDLLPSYLKNWGEHSWKKHFIHYLIEKGRYFVFPNTSLTTNFEDAGTHTSHSGLFQVDLQLEEKNFHFIAANASKIKYDAWFELLPECFHHFTDVLQDYAFTVDLHGQKGPDYSTDYVLTSRPWNEPTLAFSGQMRPLELNIISNLKGKEIGLYPKRSQSEERKPDVWYYKERGIARSVFRYAPHSIGVVVSVDYGEVDALADTLDSIANQEYEKIACLIHTPTAHLDGVKQMLAEGNWNQNLNLQIVSSPTASNDFEHIHKGLQQLNTELVSWLAAGSTFDAACFAKVNSIFNDFQSIAWLIQSPDEVKMQRWSQQLLYKEVALKGNKVSTEGMFWRRHVWQEIEIFGYESQALLAISSKHFSYSVVTAFGSFGKGLQRETIPLELKNQLASQYQNTFPSASPKAKFAAGMVRMVKGRKSKSSYIYATATQMQDLLRYDGEHNTFYLSRI